VSWAESRVYVLLLGWLGLVLATQLMAAALVIVKMLYVEDMPGDQITPTDKAREE